MLTTEQEAQEKWCCMSLSSDKKDMKCAASECMAWRWAADPKIWSQPAGEEPRRGYCGIAGRVIEA